MVFLAGRELDWREVRLEDVGAFGRLVAAAAGGAGRARVAGIMKIR